jgi:2-polyprenyl-6-methoxyphenol hydroxylase-like FAD-dependent oxidoreductase
MNSRGKHAVVLGGSIAGLLAARTLSDHFQEVTILERDAFNADGQPRKGVPQGSHSHGLLAGGLRALELMFPGFAAGARERGGEVDHDIGDFGDWYVGGVPTLRVRSGVRGMLMSRIGLESYIRELVLRRDNVAIATGRVARGLLGDAQRVLGVSVVDRDGTHLPSTFEADLVVDATGRGSQLPRWLKDLGVAAPREQRVRADVIYTSCYVRRKRSHLGGESALIVTPPPPSRRGAAVLAVEGSRYIVTLSGYLGEPGPSDYAGMIEYTRDIQPHALYQLLCDAEPLSEPVQMRDPESRWRRYDRIARFPQGLLVCGDALCSFNPAYGQGMSVAALESDALAGCLRQGQTRLAPRFFRAATAILAAPWAVAVGGDFAYREVVGERPFGTALLNAYFARLHRAAGKSAQVALARLRVTHLLAAPHTLLTPGIIARVLRFGGSGAAELRLAASATGS